MGQPQVKRKKLSIAEWLALEEAEGVRYEYHNGEVFAMAGGTLNHTRIGKNALVALERSFETDNKECEAFQSEIKLEIDPSNKYVYPDVIAVCGDIEESEDTKGAVKNPVIVIEVTSKSSEAYDRTKKYEYYTNLPSVKQYLVVSQFQPFVTLYNRNPETDVFDLPPLEVRGLLGSIGLYSVDCVLEMAVLYRNVEFDKSEIYLYSVK